MAKDDAFIKVGRHAVLVQGQRVPATFFKHGQPGNRFVVYPAAMDMLSHVRARDLESILAAYRRQLLAKKRSDAPSRAMQTSARKPKPKPTVARVKPKPARIKATAAAKTPPPQTAPALREAGPAGAGIRHAEAGPDGRRVRR